jgi:hypothetical protein
MRVYECLVWGKTPEQFVSDSLVEFVERCVFEGSTFKVKSVPENTDPARITSGLAGYYPPYGVAYLSDPDSENGLIGIDTARKKLIFSRYESPFFNQRDSVVYSTPENRFVREGFFDAVKEFKSNGYRIFCFLPQRSGDHLARYHNLHEVSVKAELTLAELL